MTTTLNVRSGGPGRAEAERRAESADILSACPDYPGTAMLDLLRATEYSYLDEGGHIYLDYAGAGLPARAQLAAHTERIQGGCFGNPHSENPASAASTELIEAARAAVLAHFNAPPEEYATIFTGNATGACRLIGEAYPFGPRTPLVLTADNHNSVNGLREFARARGAATRYVTFGSPELRVDDDTVHHALTRPRPSRPGCWPTQRRATSAGSSTRWPGSRRPTTSAMTCCWTRRRTCRRAGWTCPWSSPTSCRSAGTRCSATRPASAA